MTYGLAEFVAAEEMYRTRGFWWSPDGQRLLVARVDTTPVARWHISDPAHPDRPPVEVAYPQAGTANADVSVVLAGLDGRLTPVGWDSSDAPYLISAHWSRGGPALLQVSSRDQRTMRVLAVAEDGTVERICEDTDPDWVDVVVGHPGLDAGRRAGPGGGQRRRVPADDRRRRRSPPVELNVAGVLDVGDDVLFTANGQDPAELHVYTSRPGRRRPSSAREPGVHQAARRGDLRGHVIPVAGLVRRSGAGLARRRADRGDRVARRDPGAHPGGDVPNRRRALSCGARCCCRAGTSAARRGCRCCATPTAARPPSGWSPPATRT